MFGKITSIDWQLAGMVGQLLNGVDQDGVLVCVISGVFSHYVLHLNDPAEEHVFSYLWQAQEFANQKLVKNGATKLTMQINGVTIVSLPITPAQPDLKAYPFSALNLFPNYNRATFLAMYSVQAPPCDPTRTYKTWLDTSFQTGMKTYDILTADGEHQTLTMTPAQAQRINLEGPYTYPVFYSADSTPAINITFGTSQPYNALLLSDHQHALDLAKALWAPAAAPSTAVTEAPDEGTIQWNVETRRPWNVAAPNGGNYLAAPLLLKMWANGIGYPGVWDLSDVDNPVWTAAAQPVSNLGVVPTPVRWPLLANESIVAVSAGMEYEIVRTDM